MTRAIILTAALSLALAPALAHAQTANDPQGVIATTEALGGVWTDCLLGIEAIETGGTYRADAYNPSSGATGPLQFLPSGGAWDETPLGEAGVPVAAASVAQQVEQAVWVLWNLGPSPWAGSAGPSCWGG